MALIVCIFTNKCPHVQKNTKGVGLCWRHYTVSKLMERLEGGASVETREDGGKETFQVLLIKPSC